MLNDAMVAERLTAQPRAPTRPPVRSAHPLVRFTRKPAKRVPLAPMTLRGPTDGDVEAVDAEGGTPTLPEVLLLGVGFHLLRPATLAPLDPLETPAVTHSVSFPLRSSASPPGWKEGGKCRSWTLLNAERRWRAVTCLLQPRN